MQTCWQPDQASESFPCQAEILVYKSGFLIAGAQVTLEQLLQRLVLGNVAMTALVLATSAAAFVEQQRRLAGLVLPDGMAVQAAQPGTVQLSLK